MKKLVLILIVIKILVPCRAKADFWGGDVVVLTQILSNAVQQLAQLRSLMQNGQDSLNLMRDINQGINDSLNLARAVSPNSDPGIYKDWDQASGALSKLESIYGIAAESNDTRVQQDTDESVAEAIALNNSIYKYSKSVDDMGDLIRIESQAASPGRATKLTAASLGIMLNLQNEMLRTQATGIKLQAQTLALQNRKDKDRTRQMVAGADDLNAALASQKPQFILPRFN